MDDVICQVCGGLMIMWHQGIYDCEDCGNMIDMDIFVEDEKEVNAVKDDAK